MSLWDFFKKNVVTLAPENLARQWGRLNFQSVVRYVPKAPVFVHCHACRWPVNSKRTHLLLGGGEAVEAGEEKMRRICEGVRMRMADEFDAQMEALARAEAESKAMHDACVQKARELTCADCAGTGVAVTHCYGCDAGVIGHDCDADEMQCENAIHGVRKSMGAA